MEIKCNSSLSVSFSAWTGGAFLQAESEAIGSVAALRGAPNTAGHCPGRCRASPGSGQAARGDHAAGVECAADRAGHRDSPSSAGIELAPVMHFGLLLAMFGYYIPRYRLNDFFLPNLSTHMFIFLFNYLLYDELYLLRRLLRLQNGVQHPLCY